jgi:hypothetical protein
VGSQNVAVGRNALQTVTSIQQNVAVGNNSLNALNDAGSGANTGLGHNSLLNTTSGSYNTGVGAFSLQANTTATNNTAVGYQAGYTGTTSYSGVFVGRQAGYSQSANPYSTFIGDQAGYTTTGASNTFIGAGAGYSVSSGAKNTIIGGYTGNQGSLDIRTSNNYIVLSDGDGNPLFYMQNGVGTWSKAIGSGAGTNALKFNTGSGLITYDTSSARYKNNIRDSIYGLSHVMQMRSAQFEYKDDGRPDVGLIAEELQPIIPELVGVNKEGQADSVSYDRMVSVLVKAIQELKTEFDAYKASHP